MSHQIMAAIPPGLNCIAYEECGDDAMVACGFQGSFDEEEPPMDYGSGAGMGSGPMEMPPMEMPPMDTYVGILTHDRSEERRV